MSDDGFRTSVRDFILSALPADIRTRTLRGYHRTREDTAFWTARLNERGWSVPHWPVEYGGPGWTIAQRHIFDEECFRLGAPTLSPQGVHLVGPVIYSVGSEAQKDRFLPGIRSGEEIWAQGFSEPDAGSDLASLRTSALREGDHYVVNGQKIWNSEAHFSDWIFLLVRTTPGGKPQAGISFMLVNLKTPGITVRPITSIDEADSLAEVFFEDVIVPAENLVGEEGAGWTYAKTLLGHERSFSAEVPRLLYGLERLKALIGHRQAEDGSNRIRSTFRDRVAQVEIDLMAHEATVWRVVEEEASGVVSRVPTSSTLKIRGSELVQTMGELMVEVLGRHALPVYPEDLYRDGAPPDAPGPDYAFGVTADYFYRRATTIYGGSNEIQRNLIGATLLRGD
jgi:alkylation response protein AidB-like acyl-CoA dehydrogenase